MRVLTVRQPWAWAVIHGGEDVENRTRNIAGAYRGPVAIHTGKQMAKLTEEQADMLTNVIPFGLGTDHHYPLGVVIGMVDLVDSHEDDSAACYDCSDWADGNGYHLILENPRALATSIPATGRLGLWRPDADLLAAITAQLEEPTP